MNLLAHAYYSFGDADLLLGNMISDFVKGKKQYEYPPAIQRGIRLHRAIDEFTDAHEVTQELKIFFRPHYRLYAGPFVDIVFDYFLANDIDEFPDKETLYRFTQNSYIQLEGLQLYHGPQFGKMFPYMRAQNWLYNYRFDEGIKNSFEGMRRRSAYLPETDKAFETFLTHKAIMLPLAHEFLKDVKIFSANKMDQLLK